MRYQTTLEKGIFRTETGGSTANIKNTYRTSEKKDPLKPDINSHQKTQYSDSKQHSTIEQTRNQHTTNQFKQIKRNFK